MKCAILFSLVVVVSVGAQQQGPIFLSRYSGPVQQVPLSPYPEMAAIRPQIRVLSRQQVPQTIYNPAQATTPEPDRNITEDSITETTTEPQSEQAVQTKRDQRKQNEKLTEGAAQAEPLEKGVYYIYHPSGALQRVDYSTTNDVAKMAYIAQLKYQNVDPINEPIYTYDPQTLVLQQVRV